MEGIGLKEIVEMASEAAKYVDADRVGEIKLKVNAAVKEGLEKFGEICETACKSFTDENEAMIALGAYYETVFAYLYSSGASDNVAQTAAVFADEFLKEGQQHNQ